MIRSLVLAAVLVSAPAIAHAGPSGREPSPAASANEAAAARPGSLTAGPQESSDEEILKRIERKVGKDSAAAVAAVRAILKTPVQVEVPPSIPLECTPGESDPVNGKPAQAYVAAASAPELPAMQKLLDVQRTAQLLGIGGDTYFFEIKLLRRQLQKVDDLIKSYRNRPEKIAPIIAFALDVHKQVQLIGGDGNDEQQLLAKIGDYLATAIDSIARELVSQHDYRRATTLMRVARMSRLLTDSGASKNAEAAMEAALSFKLHLVFTFTVTGENGHVENWKLEGEFPLNASFDADTNQEVIKGTGDGAYMSYTNSDPVPRTRLSMEAGRLPGFSPDRRLRSMRGNGHGGPQPILRGQRVVRRAGDPRRPGGAADGENRLGAALW